MKYQNKFTKETTYSIDYTELDKIIAEEYEAYDFYSALDQSNDSTLSIQVTGNFDKYNQEDFEKFLQTKWQKYNTVPLLLNDMCRRELIKPGQYLINICW